MERPETRVVWDMSRDETARIYEDIGIKELDVNIDIRDRDILKIRNSFTTPENQQQTPTKKSISDAKHACKCQLFQNYAHGCEIDYFATLSDEVMLSILRWLPQYQLARCASINKRWNRLCMDDSLWKTVYLCEKKFRPGTLARVLKRVGLAAKLARGSIDAPLSHYVHPPLICSKFYEPMHK